MTISYSNKAVKQHRKLPDRVKKKITKQLKAYLKDSYNKGLGLKKVVGRENIWEMRLDISNRLIFSIINESHIHIIKVGPHDVLDKKK